MVIDSNFRGKISANIEDYPEGLVLVVNKPWRWTSADVIRKIKYASCRHFGKKNLKVGHAGTLDPLADGVLIVCIGNACKQAQAIQASNKQYLAGICFGAVTASYDREKDVELCRMDGMEFCDAISRESLQTAMDGMKGPQEQIAPLFSAKQVDGVRAYELARKLHKQGLKTDEAAAGLLNIGHIEIMDMQLEALTQTANDSETEASGASAGASGASGASVTGASVIGASAIGASARINVAEVPDGLPLATIRIDCSKGTYIRSIARDLGEKMGTGAFLYSLRRTKCGEFSCDNALSIEDAIQVLKPIEP